MTPFCDYCQKDMQPTEAVQALYEVLGRADGPKVDPEVFPWCCPSCHTACTDIEPVITVERIR